MIELREMKTGDRVAFYRGAVLVGRVFRRSDGQNCLGLRDADGRWVRHESRGSITDLSKAARRILAGGGEND